jgi:hypothetical protein
MKTDLQTPTNLNEFFHWLKKESEKQWENIEINKVIYGFQLQKGTKWLPGLTDAQITEYEKLLGFGFWLEFLSVTSGSVLVLEKLIRNQTKTLLPTLQLQIHIKKKVIQM